MEAVMINQESKKQTYGISFSGTITFTTRPDGDKSCTLLLPDENKLTEDNQNTLHDSVKNEKTEAPKKEANQDCFGYIALSSNNEKIFKAFKNKDVRLLGFHHGDHEHVQIYFNLAYYNELIVKNVFNSRRLNKKLFKYEKKRMLLVSPTQSMKNEDDFLNPYTIVITENKVFPLFNNTWHTDMFYKFKLRHTIRAYRKYIRSISDYPYIEKPIPSSMQEARSATKSIMLAAILARDDLTTKQKKKQIAEMNELLSR